MRCNGKELDVEVLARIEDGWQIKSCAPQIFEEDGWFLVAGPWGDELELVGKVDQGLGHWHRELFKVPRTSISAAKPGQNSPVYKFNLSDTVTREEAEKMIRAGGLVLGQCVAGVMLWSAPYNEANFSWDVAYIRCYSTGSLRLYSNIPPKSVTHIKSPGDPCNVWRIAELAEDITDVVEEKS